jgi:hypothetical protein
MKLIACSYFRLNTITPPILYPLVTAKFSLPECVNVQVVMFQVNDEEESALPS